MEILRAIEDFGDRLTERFIIGSAYRALDVVAKVIPGLDASPEITTKSWEDYATSIDSKIEKI